MRKALVAWFLVLMPWGYSAAVKSMVTSWYGHERDGCLTASGVPWDANRYWCAHRKLPFGVRLRLVNPKTGDTSWAEVVDRGPGIKGRDLDVSRRVAEELGILHRGVARVEVVSMEWRGR